MKFECYLILDLSLGHKVTICVVEKVPIVLIVISKLLLDSFCVVVCCSRACVNQGVYMSRDCTKFTFKYFTRPKRKPFFNNEFLILCSHFSCLVWASRDRVDNLFCTWPLFDCKLICLEPLSIYPAC